jgi:uncharacterized membrane protein YcaP (DUF421 family)
MDIVLRATVMYLVLFLLFRVMGKRELSQMTPFELIVLIVFGDLIQQGVTHNDFSLVGASLAIVTMAFWALAFSWLTYWFPRVETVLDGAPRVIVRDGELVRENLRRDRLTRAEILSEMRLSGIGHLDDVAWAILEPRGKMSFIKRDDAETRPQNADDGKAA